MKNKQKKELAVEEALRAHKKDEKPPTLADISQRLSRIEEILNKRRPSLGVNEAVYAFRKHIRSAHRCPDNFSYLLEAFQATFSGRNMALITPAEVEGFLQFHWGRARDSTLAKRTDQLRALFGFSARHLQRNGYAGFTNPCDLIRRVRPSRDPRRGFIGVDKMNELLSACEQPKTWLLVAIPLTSGIRVGELLKLRPKDVNGRVLTLLNPKSGREKEYAVIPRGVAEKLADYTRDTPRGKAIFPTTRSVVCRLVKRHGQRVGLDITTHDLRRCCATFWERRGDMGMMRFVLRHSSVRASSGEVVINPLESRYVSSLSAQEAMERQDRIMSKELGL